MTEMSSTLTSESKRYAVKAKDIHRQALLRKYIPIAVVVLVVMVVLYIRSVFYT